MRAKAEEILRPHSRIYEVLRGYYRAALVSIASEGICGRRKNVLRMAPEENFGGGVRCAQNLPG